MKARSIDQLAQVERRWDVDWLRIGIVLLLVPYHTARIFDFDPFFIKNQELFSWLSYWFVQPADGFAMRLLFLLAGVATWFALRRRSLSQYAGERFLRLLVPFVFGLFILAPPNAYLARRIHANYSGSFLEFYPTFFEISPLGLLDFTGGFTIAHLWFILFLFLVSLAALPFIQFFRTKMSRQITRGLGDFFSRPFMILLLALPPLGIEWLMLRYSKLLFPLGVVFYLIFFLYGYLLMMEASLETPIEKYRGISLFLGPVLYTVIGAIQANTWIPDWLQFIYFHGLFPWFTVLTLLGYGKKYLNHPPQRRASGLFLMYFGAGSYPFYLLHQTILVFIGFHVVQWQSPAAVKYAVIVTAAYALTVLVYDIFIRRTNLTRFLFGMRPVKKQLATPSLENALRSEEPTPTELRTE